MQPAFRRPGFVCADHVVEVPLGLPSLTAGADEVYRAASPRVLAANERYFERYPGDQDIARRIVDHLGEHDVRLPGGERLTPRRFQTLGIGLGSSV